MYGISVLCRYRIVRSCSIRFYSNKGTKKLLEFLADMPKVNSPRIAEAQRQRQNISKKSDKYAPSTVYLQVIGSGARGAPNTLYLFTDQKRYLFNCGECTQRLAHEHKVKLSRLDHIFITSKTWRNIGGLPGLSLTLQDVGVPNITLHGPEGLDELYHATRRFVVMKDMNVTMAKCTHTEDFEDNGLTVKYVLLGPHDSLLTQDKPVAKKPRLDNTDKEFEEFIHDETDYYKSDFSRNKNVIEKSKPKPKTTDVEKDKVTKKSEKVLHDLQKKSHCSVAYICTLKKRLGTLDLAKCVEFGVKPGPLLGQLKNGQDVMLPDGTIVLSKDVKTPDDPGPVFIVIEVPDLSYLKETEFAAHFDNGVNPPENIPSLVVHYTPPHIFNHPVYRAFMAMFGPSTRHLVLNSQNTCLGSEAVHRTQHKLNLLDSEIFPLLRDGSVPAVWNSSPAPNNDSPTRRGLEDLKNKIALAQFQNIINMEGSKGDGQVYKEEGDGTKLEVIAARTLTMFHLRPKRQVDRSAEPKLHIQDYIQEPMDVDGFVGSLEHFRRLVDNMRYARTDSVKEYPKVVFLGTGSCIPSKTRNTSAMALQIDENRSMLMDCGEGTFGQLVRFFGPKKVNAFLRTLKAIYVSHLHADHHIGLVGVLQARREAFEQAGLPLEPVILLAPGQIITWLSVYDQLFERIKPDFTLIPNQNLLEESTPAESSSGDLTSAVLANIGVQKIRTCLVSHCPNAFGVAVYIDNVHKLTYSGDTIPCEALVNIGKDSTLLIHEATMEDELADEARVKMHSTTTQAIDIGRQMNAKYTVLTHFSQRYARLPRLNANILHDNNTVGIAFDNMQISMNDLELLPQMYAPLQLMFAEHCVEMEMKAQHRARHKQRQERRSSSSSNLPSSETTPKSDAPGPVSHGSRRVSPGCRAATSLPVPHANYRESNASRLRQEIKGMTITGIVKKGPRSKSSSPIKRSANPSPTHSLNSDAPVPPRRRSSERTIDLISTPRTLSDTSNCSKEGSINFKITSSAPCGYIVDTHSKTLHTLTAPSKEKESKFTKKDVNTIAAPNHTINSTSISGYGRPLVTPVKKKLMVRRDFDLQPRSPSKNTNNVKSPTLYGAKASVKTCKVNFKPPFNTSPKCTDNLAKPELLSNLRVGTITSILIHLIIWRVAHIASFLFVKMWPCAIAFIALSIVFWTATKETRSTNSLRSHIPISARREDASLDAKNKAVVKQQRPASATTNKTTSKSPIKHMKSVEGKTQDVNTPASRNKVKSTKLDQQPGKPTPNQVVHVSPTRTSATRIPKKICSENSIKGAPLRNSSTEKLKQQFCRDTPVYAAGRPNSMHSSTKTFKPQLEDIKSSYVLLNKQQQEQENKLKAVPDNENSTHKFKQKNNNENERKKRLNEIKKQYQSKEFFDKTKYDKIEGLNWISWKL